VTPLTPILGTSTRRSRHYGGRPLLQVAAVQAAALGHLLTTPAAPLTGAAVPDAPGVYSLSYNGSHELLDAFARERSILYVGTGMLRPRWRAHIRSLTEAFDLDPAEFDFRAVRYGSHCEAHLAERLLIDALRPVWNNDSFAGFGSGAQGASRIATQRATAWDVLFPGRSNRAKPTEQDAPRRSDLAARMKLYPILTWPGD
jgi:hypothetical protein